VNVFLSNSSKRLITTREAFVFAPQSGGRHRHASAFDATTAWCVGRWDFSTVVRRVDWTYRPTTRLTIGQVFSPSELSVR
jgi:hypothetical protein